MRLLHTSDWHLGASTGPASRTDEQRWFLEWLRETLAAREIDVLVVAGDVFDSMHPSAEAQAIYYRFLAGAASTGVRDVVVVGGNHDSASGLDAPEAVLAAMDVHIVGGVPASGERLERMVVPLRNRGSDDVSAVIVGDEPPRVEQVGVPRSRDLVQLTGPPEAVLADLAALRWETRLPPLVHVCVETPMVEPGLNRRLNEAVAHHPDEARPVLVEVQQRSLVEASSEAAPALPALDELRPVQVFDLLCDARQVEDEERTKLRDAFGTLASADAETLEAMLADIDRLELSQGDMS